MPNDQESAKRAAARHAVSYIEDGMIVGLGTGSTAYFALEALAERVRSGLDIRGVPTSIRTAELAQSFDIPLMDDYEGFEKVDVTVDGADEIDDSLQAIKGGGGALTREKIVAAATDQQIIMVDQSKLVARLGAFPVAVEVLQMGWRVCQRRLEALGCRARLRRQQEGAEFLTDNGHYILDCAFDRIDSPAELERTINGIPGVVENGLFVDLVDLLVVGFPDGRVEVHHAPEKSR